MSFEINNSMEEGGHFIQLSGEGSTFEYRGNFPYSVKLIRNTTDNSILLDVLLREDTPIYIEDAAIENPNLNSDTIDKVIKQGLEMKDHSANLVLSLSKHPKLSLATMRYVVSKYKANSQSYDSDINYTVFLIRMCGNVNISTEILDDLAKISVNEGVLQAVLINQKCSTETIRYLLSGEKGGISNSQINRVLTPYAIKNRNCPSDIVIRYMKEHNMIKKQDPNTHEIEYHEEVEKPKNKNNSLEELKQLISINLNEKITVAQVNKRDKETQDYVNFFTKKYGRNYDLWNWSYICSEHYKLTENFIREFKNVVEWDYISYYQKLSEDFMREFQDRLNWYYIGAKQILSENLIRDFQDRLDWDIISQYQKLSEDFMREFKDKINMRLLAEYNPSCPPELRIKWMKDNNLIKKQDPETHEIEYHEIDTPKPNNSLEELKKLIQ